MSCLLSGGAAKKPQIAAKYGVDVKDAQALQNLIKQMTAERKRWANFGLHEDLIKEANDAVMVELGIKTQAQVDAENGVLPLEGEGGSVENGVLPLESEGGMRSDGATGLLFGDEVGIQGGLWGNTNVLGQEAVSDGQEAVSDSQEDERDGYEYELREGDVSAEDMKRVFGFRTVDVGKIGQKKLTGALNAQYDAFMCLARLLRLPARAIGHEGNLGLNISDGTLTRLHQPAGVKAIYAQNKLGKHTRRYIATKQTASGHLAHEWFHSFDNYFSYAEEPRSSDFASILITGGDANRSLMNPAAKAAFLKLKGEVEKVLPYDEICNKFGVQYARYRARSTEALAFAFEKYVYLKLEEQGVEPPTELVGDRERFEDEDLFYPSVEEMKFISPAFDAFFDALTVTKKESGDYRVFSMDVDRMLGAVIKSATDNRVTFDGENPDITFSVVEAEEMEVVNERWRGVLREYEAGRITNKSKDIRIGTTPAVLQMLGVRALDLTITGGVLDKVTKGKHAVPLSELGRLPEALSRPIAVFESVTQAESMVVLTELTEGDSNVVVAVHLNANNGRVQVNRIASLYGKDNPRALLNQPLLYWDNKKAGTWLTTNRLQLPSVGPSKLRTKRRVLTPRDLYKWKVEKSLSSTTFSIVGEKAESFMEYHNRGLSYTDPADGKRKVILDSRGVRLKKERMGLSEGGHVNVSLAAALEFPELFRAYPALRGLRVDFYRDSRSNAGGFTDPQEHYIAVNVACGEKAADAGLLVNTILHEVQHVIQGYEGFAKGSAEMSREKALKYIDESLEQLKGRDDEWAKEALPRLERMRGKVEDGTLEPSSVYILSHGEQEARLAGRFGENGVGVVMSGLNGFRLLEAPQLSIPLTGDITELGGITFGGGRFGRMADRILAPNGDWVYDEMVFKMRAAVQRSVSKLSLYDTGDRERGQANTMPLV